MTKPMRRALAAAFVIFAIGAIAAGGADAAGRCYWSEGCARQCIDGYQSTGLTKKVPGRTCRKVWCCDEAGMQNIQNDPGWRCRNKVCGNKSGIAYLQCMKNCE